MLKRNERLVSRIGRRQLHCLVLDDKALAAKRNVFDRSPRCLAFRSIPMAMFKESIMPLLMLWGHGSFRTNFGYFKVPQHVEIHFFVPDNTNLDDEAIRYFEYGDLRQGVTDQLVLGAKEAQQSVGRIVKVYKDLVKNYKLESILGDFLAPTAKNALKNDNVWTPGKETGNGNELKHLHDIVTESAHLGSVADPMIIQWCACTQNYIGSDEAKAPVSKGSKITNKQKGCGCYITTATCTSLALPDDCEPLRKLRWFRDEVVLSTPPGEADIQDYYATAPEIVRAIEREPNPAAIYCYIYRDYLVLALAAIDRGDHRSAYRIYECMVANLKRRYGLH